MIYVLYFLRRRNFYFFFFFENRRVTAPRTMIYENSFVFIIKRDMARNRGWSYRPISAASVLSDPKI